MKIKYMIDSVLRDKDAESPVYDPVGVWLTGGGRVEILYSGSGERIAERMGRTEALLERLKAVKVIPNDFLEYHMRQRSQYDGVFSDIMETEDFGTLKECGEAVLRTLV